ncbi:hypothetical protein THUN1379_08490 [Paludibacterium sp. THUN1379]|uniref:hypothetical protein n=1 Tax=Paludibacterium sp. THUN1379 TaxID=3112107 RepID=UPI00308FC972|nr:hypothetical protein THUN1379_08490 [Paludibacterium sp. THUN1379]
MIEVKSYQSINCIDFDSEQTYVISLFGAPDCRSINREKEVKFHFRDFILRFDANSGGLRECTLLPGCNAKVNGYSVEWFDGFLNWLALEDGDLKEVYGFVLSLKLGLAVTGFHDGDESQKAIHAFRHGDWDMFLGEMKPFKLPS